MDPQCMNVLIMVAKTVTVPVVFLSHVCYKVHVLLS